MSHARENGSSRSDAGVIREGVPLMPGTKQDYGYGR